MTRENHVRAPAESSRSQALREIVPWSSPMTRTDKILIACIVTGGLLVLGSFPLRPLLIADHPVGLSALTGGLPTIAAGAAFARIGEANLWLVVFAAIFGMINLDWLFWLAGRTWGPKAVSFFTPGRYATKFAARMEKVPGWVVCLLVVLAFLPGIPKLLVHLFAGLSGMHLRIFLLFDILGAALITGIVVGLGHAMGKTAVDLVLLVDKYALYVTVGILAVAGYMAGSAARKRRSEASRGAG